MTTRALPLAFAAVILTLAGSCSSNGPRQFQVSGSVTHNGTLVPMGTLFFEPDAESGNRGPGVLIEFRDGHFRTERGKGIASGPHLVRILGYDGKGDDRGESFRGRQLFPEQIQHVELPAHDSTRDFEVTTAAR